LNSFKKVSALILPQLPEKGKKNFTTGITTKDIGFPLYVHTDFVENDETD
jgi:hypothetical protein